MIYYIKFIVKYYKFSTILKILHDIFITIKIFLFGTLKIYMSEYVSS